MMKTWAQKIVFLVGAVLNSLETNLVSTIRNGTKKSLKMNRKRDVATLRGLRAAPRLFEFGHEHDEIKNSYVCNKKVRPMSLTPS